MARPRVFVSSTFFDLRQVRADLETFIRELGYDSVMNERGQIAYGSADKLEEYCYREIPTVDILVSIIGGRFGSASQHAPDSISQVELKTALDLGKQVYIFIDKTVYAEFYTYKANKGNDTVKYAAVNDVRIHRFIEYVESLPQNNTIQAFESADDIVKFLREQWAGLFQRYLQDASRSKEKREIEDLQATAQTLQELVKFLADEKKGSSAAVQDILLSTHPAMEHVRNLLGITHRVFFTTRNEFSDLLRAHGYEPTPVEAWHQPEEPEWRKVANGFVHEVHVAASVFDEKGRLRPSDVGNWDNENISLEKKDNSAGGHHDVRPAPNRTGAASSAEDRRPHLATVQEQARTCVRCALHEGRQHGVFSRGDPFAELAFVGEGPGTDEDARGEPFVGRAGEKLDQLIAAMGYERDDVYITNVVKCRPPNNRKPEAAEVESCMPFLAAEFDLVRPKVIVALGATATAALCNTTEGITKARGRWKLYKGTTPVMPTFHPAYLLKAPDAESVTWSDLCEVLKHLGRVPPSAAETADAQTSGEAQAFLRAAPNLASRPGTKVSHEIFGSGIIEAVEAGTDPAVTVEFHGHGRKRIKSRFLKFIGDD